MEIHWIPAHTGVVGNELADDLAKRATGWTSEGRPGSQAPTPPAMRVLISAAKQQIQARSKIRWSEIWEDDAHGRHLRSQHQAEPNKKTLDKYRDLKAWQASIVAQLRTGKLGLNDYLHSIDAVEVSGPIACIHNTFLGRHFCHVRSIIARYIVLKTQDACIS